ncbi:MAG: ATP-binding cassette domain-containing protein, partial [Thermoleophilia bacterium]|nr:ATP-binding cassette domain-containing protein [Thermoleophilia bacterium]
EIVALPLRFLGVRGPPAHRRAASLLRTAGLGGREDARPYELSGGEQQRVAVCAALAKRPALVLADEPTGELDASASAIVVELLLELAETTGAAGLIVTHDEAVALRTPRTIHVRDGRLAAEGATDPVLVVDEQGWVRLPESLRVEAGLGNRVRASVRAGRLELAPDAEAAPVRDRAAEPATEAGADDGRDVATEVVLADVRKSFGAQHVVTGLSHVFSSGRLHVVAGPSGSGKTTVLSLVAALERPEAGRVTVAGEPVDELEGDEAARWRQRTLGYLSQHSELAGSLSALENVELALLLRGRPRPEARAHAERLLQWVGLEKLGDRRADRLSGGEQRRVALARALASGPPLLVADEPTAHLDRFSGRVIIALLQRAAKRGTTVVAASHDPDLIAAADERLVL